MNNWITEPEELQDLHKLFDVVRCYTLAGGGDGDGYIVSGNYKELADLFYEYETREGKGWFINRHEYPSQISFNHEQEAVHFIDTTQQLPVFNDVNYGGQIVVKIFWKGY